MRLNASHVKQAQRFTKPVQVHARITDLDDCGRHADGLTVAAEHIEPLHRVGHIEPCARRCPATHHALSPWDVIEAALLRLERS